MIEIKNIHKSFGQLEVLKGIDLSIKKGEIVVLTGLSGCGKTTLLRLLNGLIPSFYDGDFDGEIKIVTDEDGKLVWECPNCGNRDQDKMNVARRTCGYIGTQYWNQGRTQEIAERVLHL